MKIKIFSRKQWGARYANGFGTRPLPDEYVYLHHSVTPAPAKNASFAKEAAAMRTLENIGQSRFGHGISYNRLIMPSGHIFSGVSVGRIGAHTANRNTKGIGVCLVGNYETKALNSTQIYQLIQLLRYMRADGQCVKDAKYIPHSAVKATACPGKHTRVKIGFINTIADNHRKYDRKLRPGMRGNDVYWVQARLRSLGYDVPFNGKYDDATTKAVKALKWKKYHVSQTGVGGTFWKYLSDK